MIRGIERKCDDRQTDTYVGLVLKYPIRTVLLKVKHIQEFHGELVRTWFLDSISRDCVLWSEANPKILDFEQSGVVLMLLIWTPYPNSFAFGLGNLQKSVLFLVWICPYCVWHFKQTYHILRNEAYKTLMYHFSRDFVKMQILQFRWSGMADDLHC